MTEETFNIAQEKNRKIFNYKSALDAAKTQKIDISFDNKFVSHLLSKETRIEIIKMINEDIKTQLKNEIHQFDCL